MRRRPRWRPRPPSRSESRRPRLGAKLSERIGKPSPDRVDPQRRGVQYAAAAVRERHHPRHVRVFAAVHNQSSPPDVVANALES